MKKIGIFCLTALLALGYGCVSPETDSKTAASGDAASEAVPYKDPITFSIVSQAEPIFRKGEKLRFAITATQGKEFVRQGRMTIDFTNSGGKVLCRKLADFSRENPVKIAFSVEEPCLVMATGKNFTGGPEDTPIGSMPVHVAAYAPGRIFPSAPEPGDFMEFWRKGLKEVKDAPVEVMPFPGKDYEFHEPFLITVSMPGNEKFYALMLVPKTFAPHQIWISIPGADAGAGSVWVDPGAKDRIIVLMHVHKFPPSADPAKMNQKYNEYNEKFGEYYLENAADRDHYFYRRVFLGMSRVVDYLCSRPDWDGKNVIVTGSSQGGACAMALAALNPLVSAVSVNVPAMCDHTGWKVGRTSGWPQLHEKVPASDAAAPYFDTVNFARHIKVPAFMAVGFLDMTAPAAGGYAAYNQLKGPKKMFPMFNRAHELSPEYFKERNEFLEMVIK